jgi:hypothetical protein
VENTRRNGYNRTINSYFPFCSYVVQIYNLDFQCIMLFYNSPFRNDMPQSASDPSFEALLQKEGYSERVIEEIWKWYDFSDKKGVASF